MVGKMVVRGLLVGTVLVSLAACEGGPLAGIGAKLKGDGGEGAAPASSSTRIVERDVEAPEVFSLDETGLWDGRPSLGGVWVAHEKAKDPERVIIRNPANGKFVIGALFRRETAMPGPKVQVSSDAAAALGMLAGSPAKLSVVALRREGGGEDPAAEAAPEEAAAAPEAQIGDLAGSDNAVAAAPLAPAAPAAVAVAAAAEAAPPAAPAKPAAALTRKYIQIGIFSVEDNAKKAAKAMRDAGLKAEIKKDGSQGKTFWRVIVGPAADQAARDAMAAKVKTLGYPDAYAVSG